MATEYCAAHSVTGCRSTHAFGAEPFALGHCRQIQTAKMPGQAAAVAENELSNVATCEAEILMLANASSGSQMV